MTQTMRSAIDDIVQGADVQQVLDKAVEQIDADIKANEGYPEPETS
jgi:maltose-binding protein MalE